MSLKFVQALSVVAPSGQKIANGINTIEIRSWCPDQLPIKKSTDCRKRELFNE